MSLIQRREHRRFVHEAAAGRVHENGAARKPRDLGGPDHALRLGRQGNVEGQDLRAREEIVQRQGLHPEIAHRVAVDQGIVAHALHLEGSRALRHRPPDLSQPHDPDRLPPKLAPLEARLVPLAALEGAVRGGDLAEEAEQEPEHQLRNGHGIRPGDVQDAHAALPRRRPVDVVDAGARAGDPAQLGGRLDQAPRHLRGAAHDPGVDVADERKKLGLGEAAALLDMKAGRLAKDRDGALGEWIADEDVNRHARREP